jgi:UDP-glucose:(heptosyl)LPS alpha-1,3-glucosyltransferase
MKFAFCLFKYYPYGGLSRDCVRIARLCQERGHSVDIFTMHWEGEQPAGVNVICVPVRGLTNHWRCYSFVTNLVNKMKIQDYAAIIGFNRMPGLDIYYVGDVCYEWAVEQKHGFFYRFSPRYKIYSAFEKAVFSPQAKTQIMYRSEMLKQQYMEYYGTPESRFYLLKPGIDITRKAPENIVQIRSEYRFGYGLDDLKQVILLIGSNFQLKGLDRALIAVASLPEKLRNNVLLWVIGKGKKNLFMHQAKSLGIAPQVKFLDITNNIPNLLFMADLLLHPAYQEAMGWVILEAIVSGLPVLTTANCGFACHVKRANAGLVVPMPFKQIVLNAYLQKMLSSKELQEWKKNALAYGKNDTLYGHADVVDIIEKHHIS